MTPTSAHASWIMRLINTPPDLLGAFIGLGSEEEFEPSTSLSMPSLKNLSLPKMPEISLGSTASAMAVPIEDLEKSVSSDYNSFFYTRPDAALVSRSSTENIRRTLTIGKGQSFESMFRDLGLSASDRKNAMASIKNRYDIKRLQAGAKVDVMLNARVLPGQNGRLESFYTKPDNLTTLRLEMVEDGKFICRTTEKKLKKTWVLAEGRIAKGSIYSDGKDAGIPQRIIANTVRAYRHSMDLDRKLQKGDSFKVLFEATLDPDNKILKSGELLYASVNLKGNEQSLYWFENGSKSGFYYPSGRSQKQGSSLLQKPISGGRISSTFKRRFHPVLKTWRMHKGVDYAAPTGTPIYAAGDGKVVHRGWKGAYGRFIEIKHNNTYSTAYAHLSRYSSKVKYGSTVRKGQLIGYIGSSGRSTGPHLHYELRKNGTQVNPMTSKITKSLDLSGSTKAKFEAQRDKIRSYQNKATSNKVARLP